MVISAVSTRIGPIPVCSNDHHLRSPDHQGFRKYYFPERIAKQQNQLGQRVQRQQAIHNFLGKDAAIN